MSEREERFFFAREGERAESPGVTVKVIPIFICDASWNQGRKRSFPRTPQEQVRNLVPALFDKRSLKRKGNAPGRDGAWLLTRHVPSHVPWRSRTPMSDHEFSMT